MTTPIASTNEMQNPLAFNNLEERDQLSDEMISLRFLAQVDQIMAREHISKKELASRLKTSPSYVTQLFQGDKLINVRLLTKLKRALNVTIDIVCHPVMPSHLDTLSVHTLELPESSQGAFPTSFLLNITSTMTVSVVDSHEAYISRNEAVIHMKADKETGAYSFDPNPKSTFGYVEY